MGKRSDFERNPRDYYPTPYDAVIPLLPWIAHANFCEPCAGNGALISHLERHAHRCHYAFDIEPQVEWIEKADVLFFGFELPKCEMIITNPPWERGPLHEMIEKFRNHARTWLLFDSDWMFTGQAKPFLKYCQKIISVGRVSWMENGTSGMDNCAWYLFDKEQCETKFINR